MMEMTQNQSRNDILHIVLNLLILSELSRFKKQNRRGYKLSGVKGGMY